MLEVALSFLIGHWAATTYPNVWAGMLVSIMMQLGGAISLALLYLVALSFDPGFGFVVLSWMRMSFLGLFWFAMVRYRARTAKRRKIPQLD